MRDRGDVRAIRPDDAQNLLDAGDKAICRIPRRRGGLGRAQDTRILVESDDIGKRAAGVDAHADPSLRHGLDSTDNGGPHALSILARGSAVCRHTSLHVRDCGGVHTH